MLRAQRHEDWREAAPGARPQGHEAEAACTRITEASARPGSEERSLTMVGASHESTSEMISSC